MLPESPSAGIGVVAVDGDKWSDPIGLVGEQGVGMLPVSPSVGIGVVVGRCVKFSSLMISFQSLVAPSVSSIALVPACRAASTACSQYCFSTREKDASCTTLISNIHLSASDTHSTPMSSWRSISLSKSSFALNTLVPLVR